MKKSGGTKFPSELTMGTTLGGTHFKDHNNSFNLDNKTQKVFSKKKSVEDRYTGIGKK
jgi:hypothetical protein